MLQLSLKLAVQTITSNENNVDNLKICIKQYLSKLNYADKLFKKIEDSGKDKPM